MLRTSKGFTIKELMIAISVVIVFGIVAFYALRDYGRRYYYNAIVQEANTLKQAINYCFEDLKTLKGCNGGSHHIPADIKTPHGALANLTVKDGVITAAPVAWDGITAEDLFILTPTIVHGELVWTPSGSGMTHGYTG